MKIFRLWRANKTVVVVELSFIDILKLLVGREVYFRDLPATDGFAVLRHQHAYEAFNLMAPKAE